MARLTAPLTDEEIPSEIARLADLAGLYGDRVAYVAEDGDDSAHPNRGKSWAFAYATVQAAVDALSDGVGGTVLIGPGAFPPFVLDGVTKDLRGVKVFGAGEKATSILSTMPAVDALRMISPGGGPATQVEIGGFSLLGTPWSGWGLNLGGNNWGQIGRFIARNVSIEENGAGGVLAYDINDCLFVNVAPDNNYGPNWRITGRPADGTAPVMRGNTNVFLNCRTQGRDDRSTNGWEFLNCGNSMTVIGGETSYCAEAVVVTQGGGQNGLSFLGVHFENNLRAAHLGDQAATGGDAIATFRSCYFLGAPGSPDEVLLDGVIRTHFEDCTFAGSTTAAIKEAAGRANGYTVENCASSTAPLITLADGTTITKVSGIFTRQGRVRVDTSSSSAVDSRSGLVNLRNTGTPEPWIRLENANGPVDIYMSQGTPEGQLTAPVGSICLRRNGGADSTFYVKVTGAGNTGWAAFGAAAPVPLIARGGVYTITTSDRVILSANGATMTLPSAAAVGAGRIYTIKNTGPGTTTPVQTTSSQTIDGAAPPLNLAYQERVTVVSDGVNWQRID